MHTYPHYGVRLLRDTGNGQWRDSEVKWTVWRERGWGPSLGVGLGVYFGGHRVTGLLEAPKLTLWKPECQACKPVSFLGCSMECFILEERKTVCPATVRPPGISWAPCGGEWEGVTELPEGRGSRGRRSWPSAEHLPRAPLGCVSGVGAKNQPSGLLSRTFVFKQAAGLVLALETG